AVASTRCDSRSVEASRHGTLTTSTRPPPCSRCSSTNGGSSNCGSTTCGSTLGGEGGASGIGKQASAGRGTLGPGTGAPDRGGCSDGNPECTCCKGPGADCADA